MVDLARNRIWLGRLGFLTLALVIVFALLLPLDTLPRAWVGPDLLLLVTLVWVGRRPDHVPLPVVAGLFLLTDLLFLRPPGLWTALVVILTEVLRARARGLRGMPFLAEWVTVGIGVVAITVAWRFGHAIALVPQAPPLLAIIQTAMTILCYPLAAGLAYLAFGINRPAPGEVDALGRPL